MKKILLLEDRDTRQHLFRNMTKIDLDQYNDILDNFIADKYASFLNDVLVDRFDFSTYDIIVAHKSAFGKDNSTILSKIEAHCKKHNKPLVLFSGGIVGSYYNNEVYEVLELNSKVFYSKNLVLFLESFREENENLSMLIYGKEWKLNIVMNVIERLNLYMDIEDPKLFKHINLNSLQQLGLECEKIDAQDTIEKKTKFRNCLLDAVGGYIDA